MFHQVLPGLTPLILTMLLFSQAGAGEALPLTSCGQRVQGTVYLTGDLDCTGQPGHGVYFEGRGRLELRGFTLSNAQYDGVECMRCEVRGPGTILHAAGAGIRAAGKGKITNVTVLGSGGIGVEAGRLRMSDSRVEGNRAGILAGGATRLKNVVVTGNERWGVRAPHHDGDRCFIGRLVLKNTDVTGNATSPDCGVLYDDCIDVRSCREPRLDDDSSCDTSSTEPSGSTWGVCALD